LELEFGKKAQTVDLRAEKMAAVLDNPLESTINSPTSPTMDPKFERIVGKKGALASHVSTFFC
jgi:hypothetical protein